MTDQMDQMPPPPPPPGLRANISQDDFAPNAAIMNAWFQRVRLWLSGMQYNGARDMYAVLGYTRFLQQHDYVARYIRQDITQRIINQPVYSTWADAPQIIADPEFQAAWHEMTNPTLSGINVWQQIIRLDKLAGLGQFAVLLFGFEGQGEDLSQPVRPPRRLNGNGNGSYGNGNGAGRKLLYLQPYAEAAVRVRKYDEDRSSPRFGLPLSYNIAPGRFRPEMRTGNAGFTYTSEAGRGMFEAHYTRVLHVAEGLLEDPVYGRSRLEVVTNLLDDMLKICGGSAEAFWLLANRGMQVDVDKEMDLSPEDAMNLQQEVEDYQHEIRRFIRTRGVKLNPLASKMTDPQGPFNVCLSLLSAATGIPQSILTGSARGEQVSQQDRAAWSERIAERVAEYAEPCILAPFIRTCVNGGVLPEPKQLEISWPEAFKLSPLERSQTSAQMARSAANLGKSQKFAQDTGNKKPLFTDQEARRMVSFENRMPVFERSVGGTGSLPGPDATGSAATPGTTNGTTNGKGMDRKDSPAKARRSPTQVGRQGFGNSPPSASGGSLDTGGSPGTPGANPDPMFGTGEQEG
jgi:uncharacterized protein